jgi:hypothetical protein
MTAHNEKKDGYETDAGPFQPEIDKFPIRVQVGGSNPNQTDIQE